MKGTDAEGFGNEAHMSPYVRPRPCIPGSLGHRIRIGGDAYLSCSCPSATRCSPGERTDCTSFCPDGVFVPIEGHSVFEASTGEMPQPLFHVKHVVPDAGRISSDLLVQIFATSRHPSLLAEATPRRKNHHERKDGAIGFRPFKRRLRHRHA